MLFQLSTKLLLRQCASMRLAVRPLSAAAAPLPHQSSPNSFDAIQNAIHNILSEYEHHNNNNKLPHIADEDLYKSSQRFQHLLQEAQNCVKDCHYTDAGSLPDEERDTADAALSEASAALVDLIDDLREANLIQANHYKSIREHSAVMIKQLRNELEAIDQNS